MAQKEQQLFQLLKEDHRKVEQMMKQIERGSQKQWEEQFVGLRDALQEHFQIEEKYFYPKLQEIDEMEELIGDALEEHQEAKDFLAQLEDIEDREEWQETFQEMQKGIHHHIRDEEKKIFPKCTQVLSEQQLKQIGEQCAQAKGKARPTQARAAKGAKKPARKQVQV